ncbi:MAG: aminodeoxychorismate synthase component I [Bacteroidales bacterium]
MFIHPINKQETIEKMNRYGASSTPFLFIISYDGESNIILKDSEIDPEFILYEFQGRGNLKSQTITNREIELAKSPIDYDSYLIGFNKVQASLRRGDTFLCNLTAATNIKCNLSTREIFERSKAKYRLWVNGLFTLFSPEIFIQVKDGTIHSYPMKGTIDASIENAREVILNNVKESQEHATIVDLIRNDLSQIAHPVWVERYRYIDELETTSGKLLQVSSEICGKLPESFYNNIGTEIFKLLPAGSITGAPKLSTIKLIEDAEGYDRGFYTGVCGYFDGQNIDSAVMIRFIEEQKDNSLLFKSGGGITSESIAQEEYNELIQKVYVAIN